MAAVLTKEERRLRGLRMLEMRIAQSASQPEIARAFNVSTKTVQNTLSWLRKAGIVANAEDRVLQELVPAAHATIMKAIQNGDVQSAFRIFESMLPAFKAEGKGPKTTVETVDELASYIDNLRGGTSGFVEGEVSGTLVGSESPTAALPAAEGADASN